MTDVLQSLIENHQSRALGDNPYTDFLIENAQIPADGFDAQYIMHQNLEVPTSLDVTEDELINSQTERGRRWGYASRAVHDFLIGKPAERKQQAADEFSTLPENTRSYLRNLPPEVGQPPDLSTMPSNEAEYSKYGVELAGQLEWNFSQLAWNAAKLDGMDDLTKASFYYLMDQYGKLPDFTWSGTKRFAKGILSDPTTYAGLGALGFAALGTAGVKQATKKTVLEQIKASIKNPYILAAIEGGAYTGLDDAFRQRFAIEAEVQESYNPVQGAIATGTGVAAGPALIAGGKAVAKGVQKAAPVIRDLFDKAGQAADERIAQRDPGATLSSGVDPTQPIDAALSAAGRIARSARDADDAIDIATNEATNQATGLAEFIKNNPDGFTIDLDGFETVPSGFAVAPLKRTEIILDSADLTAANVGDLIRNVKTLTELGGQKAYAGGWFNSDDGKYYLDASLVFDNEADALYTAAAGRQIAVFNLGTFNEINTVEGFKNLRESGAFDVGRFNERRAASAELDQRAEQAGVQDPVSRERARGSQEPLDMAPPGARAHKVPHELLIKGSGEQPQYKVTQAFTAANKTANFSAIDQAKSAHPDALSTKDNWIRFQQSTFGGDLLPVPPMQAIRYAQSADNMAAKLRELTPEMKAGVDEGFKNVSVLRDMYASGQAQPKMTADLFLWGILSRGAGPVQQESAYIDIIQSANPLIEKAVNGTFSDADLKTWVTQISKNLPEGSPGKQVTMNVNAAGKLLVELSKTPEGSDKNVLGILHDMMSDQTKTATEIRREFMALTDRAGIDNKVVSFILLVGGRDDVLVMDRIQSRHLYDDGRFEGRNIYDGFVKAGTTAKEGVQGFMRGPRGLLVTEALEDGLRKNVQEAYRAIGREGDASLGRFHWETWVIDGEQVVDHETLKAVASGSPTGVGVREGKPGTFSSGMKYMRTDSGTVVEYPLSDGSNVYFTPAEMKEFEKFVKNPNNKIVPRGFKVTERTDVRWYERPEVDRDKLDAAAREQGRATIE